MLLIPTINDIRFALKKPLLPESSFFELASNPEYPQNLTTTSFDQDKLEQNGPRLRLMYQVGLLGVFKEEGVSAHIKLMTRALSRFEALTAGKSISKLWWLGRGVLASLESVELSNSRKRLLGVIDRHIKSALNDSEALDKPLSIDVVKECVYIVALADSDDSLIKEILTTFEPTKLDLSGTALSRENELMNSLSSQVIKSVVSAIKEDLSQIKDSLDLGARGARGGDDDLLQTSDALHKISKTLFMLGLVEISDVLTVQADELKEWKLEDIHADNEDFNHLADTLLQVENALSLLSPRSGNRLESGNQDDCEGVSISQLEDAREVVVRECRAGLALAQRGLVSFIESNGDSLHIANLSTTFANIAGGLTFLNQDRASQIISACEAYITTDLIRSDHLPEDHFLETLADAVTSIDYFLEGIEANKPIGNGVLDLAEASVDELGYPVCTA